MRLPPIRRKRRSCGSWPTFCSSINAGPVFTDARERNQVVLARLSRTPGGSPRRSLAGFRARSGGVREVVLRSPQALLSEGEDQDDLGSNFEALAARTSLTALSQLSLW